MSVVPEITQGPVQHGGDPPSLPEVDAAQAQSQATPSVGFDSKWGGGKTQSQVIFSVAWKDGVISKINKFLFLT